MSGIHAGFRRPSLHQPSERAETGFLLRPLTRKTWAPKGETPTLRAAAEHEQLSAIGAVTLSPKSKRTGLYWQFYDGNVGTPEFLSFLRRLRRTLKTKLVVAMICTLAVVFDRLSIPLQIASAH